MHVMSLDDESQQPFYSFSSDVRFVPIGRSGTGTFSTACQFLRMRKFASDLKPDVIFGFLPSSYIFLSILFWLTPQTFIACEHITRSWYSRRPLKYSAVVFASLLSSKMSFLSADIGRGYRGIPERKNHPAKPGKAFRKQANVMAESKHYNVERWQTCRV